MDGRSYDCDNVIVVNIWKQYFNKSSLDKPLHTDLLNENRTFLIQYGIWMKRKRSCYQNDIDAWVYESNESPAFKIGGCTYTTKFIVLSFKTSHKYAIDSMSRHNPLCPLQKIKDYFYFSIFWEDLCQWSILFRCYCIGNIWFKDLFTMQFLSPVKLS